MRKLASILLGTIATWMTVSWAQAGGIAWQSNLQTARLIAARTQRPVLIHFWADWCRPCQNMEEQVFSKPAVIDFVNRNFVPVKIHVDHFPYTAHQYGVTALPSDVIISPDGQLLAKYVGTVSADRYMAQLAQAASKYTRAGTSIQLANRPSSAGPETVAAQPDQQQTAMPSASVPVNSRLPGAGIAAVNRPQYPQPIASPAIPYGATNSAIGNRQQTATTNDLAVGPGVPQSQSENIPADRSTPQRSIAMNPIGQPPAMAIGIPGGEAMSSNSAAAVPEVGKEQSRYGNATNPAGNIAAQGTQPVAPQLPWGEFQSDPATTLTTPTQPAYAQPPVAEFQQPGSTPADYVSEQPPQVPVTIPPGNPPLGLDGYCPVQLTDNHRWVLGDPRWGLIHKGRTYLFAGPQERDKFNADPDRYAPVLSGFDVVIAAEQGRFVPGRREHGAWYQGHVYLFASEETLLKFDQNPEKYLSLIPQLEAQALWVLQQQWAPGNQLQNRPVFNGARQPATPSRWY